MEGQGGERAAGGSNTQQCTGSLPTRSEHEFLPNSNEGHLLQAGQVPAAPVLPGSSSDPVLISQMEILRTS